MNIQQLAFAAAVFMAPTAVPATEDIDERPSHFVEVARPVWPDNGIAERTLGDGDDNRPENLLVEVSEGRLHAWVLMTPERGQSKALDFFSGKVQDVRAPHPGGYNDSFIDAQGVTHSDNATPIFNYKGPTSRGWLEGIDFIGKSLEFKEKLPYAPYSFDVLQRFTDDDSVIWSKLPFYKTSSDGTWDSRINTALDLGDGTLLITADKYIFRVRLDDLAPVGQAPHLHVRDADDVARAMAEAEDKDIDDLNEYLAQKLDLQ